jgi:hypothetical protein
MGAVNDLQMQGPCPACGNELGHAFFQFKCGGKSGETYRIGDRLRWDDGPLGYCRPEDGNWDSLAIGACPHCNERIEALLEIRKDVIGCAGLILERESYRCFACDRKFPFEALTSRDLIGGSCDYGRYVCQECLGRALQGGRESSERVCGWCGDLRPALLVRGYHSICRDCASYRTPSLAGTFPARCFVCDRKPTENRGSAPSPGFLVLHTDPWFGMICIDCMKTVVASADGPAAPCSDCKRVAPARISRGGRHLCGPCFDRMKFHAPQ